MSNLVSLATSTFSRSMLQSRTTSLATRCTSIRHLYRQEGLSFRSFSTSRTRLEAIRIQVQGQGTGTIQTVSVKDKPYNFTTDTYKVLGGRDSAPSPVAYSLASLGSCNQVTGFVVARDHNITLGEWDVIVEGDLPTGVLVKGEQGNPNWESVVLKVRVQTDIKGGSHDPRFTHFVSEVERRCPITQLFQRSGVAFQSKWENLAL